MVDKFQGTFSQQVRIVGATEKPASLPYSRQHDACSTR
jgi:polysaccharide export outer membrane protein